MFELARAQAAPAAHRSNRVLLYGNIVHWIEVRVHLDNMSVRTARLVADTGTCCYGNIWRVFVREDWRISPLPDPSFQILCLRFFVLFVRAQQPSRRHRRRWKIKYILMEFCALFCSYFCFLFSGRAAPCCSLSMCALLPNLEFRLCLRKIHSITMRGKEEKKQLLSVDKNNNNEQKQ